MYLNIIIKMFIGIAAVLSIVMMVVGGLEYMTSELSHSKEAGKEKIMQAIIGLIIAIGAYALLFTINPDLLKSDPSIPTTTVKITQTGTGTAGYCSISMINNESDCKSATPPGTWTTSAGLIPGIVPNLTGIGSCSISMINNEADCKSATPPGVWTP